MTVERGKEESAGGPERVVGVPRVDVGSILQGLSFIGGLAYAAAWVFVQALFTQVGVEPETVGINAEYLSIRAVVAAGAVASAVLLLGVISGAHSSLKRLRRGQPGRFGFFVAVGCVGEGMLIGFALSSLLRYGAQVGVLWSTLSGIGGGFTAFAVQYLLVNNAFSTGVQETGEYGISAAKPIEGTAVVLLGLLAIFLLAYTAGLEVGHSVKRGYEVDNPFIALPRVEVTLDSLHPSSDTPSQDEGPYCGILLGVNGGEVTLWELQPTADDTLSLPVDRVVVESVGGCQSAAPLKAIRTNSGDRRSASRASRTVQRTTFSTLASTS